MPKFKITDSETGRAVTVSGDSAPTHEESEQIFKDAGLRNEQAAPMSLGDVAQGAITNIPSSALNLAKNIGTAVMHPIGTGTSLVNAGRGAGQEFGNYVLGNHDAAPTPQTQAFDGLKNYYGGRYGSVEGFKNAVATDPVGIAADASMVAGGAGLAAKAGGLTKAAALADRLGTISNPISLAGKGIGAAANLGGKALAEALGVTTGAGGQSVRAAYGAGLDGGSASQAFASHMRGSAPIEEIVADAHNALGNLRNQRGAEYRAGMGGVNSDPAILDLAPIDAAVSKAGSVNNFKGIDLSESTGTVRQKIADKIEQWRGLDPQEYHTTAGFDALKKSIGDIRDSAPYGTPERIIADQAYNAVKDSIVQQAPEYGKTMQDYAKASDQLADIQKTLSLGDKAATDISIRKLQSSMRDNVNTSYGRRTDLANVLMQNGAPYLMPKIAGQSLSSPTSRGLGKMLMGGELGGGIATAAAGHPLMAAAVLPAIAMQSPRLVGEAALATGKAARLGQLLAKTVIRKPKSAADAALIADELGAAQTSIGNR